MIKIGLMGCEFASPNKGCEALTYSILGAISNLKDIKESVVIYNFSGTELGNVPKFFPKFEFVNVNPSLKDLSFEFIKAIKKCDLILDVTMGDSFSDIYSEKYYNHLILRKRIAETFCNNYILLPQTYGPFNSEKSSKKAKRILKKAKKIYCRDELSKKLIEQQFNIFNSELTSDLAFMLPYDKNMFKIKNKNKTIIGINVSGLLYKGGFERENQFALTINYKSYIEQILTYFSKNEEYEVHLIPHVIDLTKNPYDDDFQVCEKLIEKFQNCKLAPAFESPIEAKSYIANMDIFIGSRMHSTIAAFSSNVVTIPVSYSRKFEGLFNSLKYEYVIDGRNENTNSAYEKTIEYVNKKEILSHKQEASLKIIKNKNKKFIESFAKVFSEIEK